MGLEFYEEKDLTGTYKQLKKIIASALGEEEFETITNAEAKVVANGIWESCYKTSIVGIEYLDIKHFFVNENEDETTCKRAIFASVGYGTTLKKSCENALKHPFINDLQPRGKVDFCQIQFPYRVMMLIAIGDEKCEPTNDDLSKAVARFENKSNEFDLLWNYQFDKSMQEPIRVCVVVMKGRNNIDVKR